MITALAIVGAAVTFVGVFVLTLVVIGCVWIVRGQARE